MKIDTKIQIITSREDFQKYRTTWDCILEEIENTNPFIEFEWVNQWWKYLGSEKNVEIMVVFNEEKCIGFVPLLYDKKISVYVYSFLAFGQANYMGIVARRKDLDFVVEQALQNINERRVHTVFFLHGLLDSERTSQAIKDFAKVQNLKLCETKTITPFINLDEIKLEKYMHKRKKLHRLDRREKRLLQNGDVEIERLPVEEIDKVFLLHKKRWEKKRDTSGFTNPQERLFYTALAHVERGPLTTELEGLYVNKKLIAFNYAFQCRGRYLGYVLGYDDDFEVFSPGRILEKESIIKRKNGDSHTFDLSIGYEAYKFDWNTGVDYTARLLISTTTIRGKIVWYMMSSKELAITKLKENQRIVKFIRNDIGEWAFHLKGFLKKDLRSHVSSFWKGFRKISKKFYQTDRYIVYHLNKEHVPKNVCALEFVPLTLEEAMNHPELSQKYLKVICQKIYGGSKGYYPKGNLSFDSIIWTNDRVLRIEQIAYLEQFKKSSISLKNWDCDNLLSFCSMLVKQSPANILYTAIAHEDIQNKEALESLGFSPLKEVVKKTFLGINRYSITE